MSRIRQAVKATPIRRYLLLAPIHSAGALPPSRSCVNSLDAAELPNRAGQRRIDNEDTVWGRKLTRALIENQ